MKIKNTISFPGGRGNTTRLVHVDEKTLVYTNKKKKPPKNKQQQYDEEGKPRRGRGKQMLFISYRLCFLSSTAVFAHRVEKTLPVVAVPVSVMSYVYDTRRIIIWCGITLQYVSATFPI